MTQPVTYDEDGLNQVVAQMDIGCPGEEFVMKDCLQHPFGLQHTKVYTFILVAIILSLMLS